MKIDQLEKICKSGTMTTSFWEAIDKAFKEFKESNEPENGNKVLFDRFESNEKQIKSLDDTIRAMAEALKVYVIATDPKIAEIEGMKKEIFEQYAYTKK